MKLKIVKSSIFLSLFSVVHMLPLAASFAGQLYRVTSASEFRSVCRGQNLQPGDSVEVADGRYDVGGVTIESSGTAENPITIRAENTGMAELTGSSYLNFRKNAHVILQGFKISAAKYTAVKLEACNNIRISRNIFQLTESPGQSGKWLYLGGYWDDCCLLRHDTDIDHNIVRDNHDLGNFINDAGGDNVSQHDRIDHNYSVNSGPRHENEMQAVRVGWSGLSLTDGFTVIEYNLFEDCDGDPEIVSIKSCKDTVRYNTFRRCAGTVSLRHGDGSVINGNFFLGEGKSGTGGVRIYARDHKIYNNYFAGLRGVTWDAAITLAKGDTDHGSLSAHWRIDGAIIAHNTLIDNFSNIEIGYAKANNFWKKQPRNVTLSGNLVVGGARDLIKIYTALQNFRWTGNMMLPQNGAGVGMTATESEIQIADPLFEQAGALWILSSASPAIDGRPDSSLALFEDVQGQPRDSLPDIGADEFSAAPVQRWPLTPQEVGPEAGISSAVNGADIAGFQRDVLRIACFPNPATDAVNIQFTLRNAANIRLMIYNLQGQKIATLAKGRRERGAHDVSWDCGTTAAGVYWVVLQTGARTASVKIVVLH